MKAHNVSGNNYRHRMVSINPHETVHLHHDAHQYDGFHLPHRTAHWHLDKASTLAKESK